MSVVIYWTPQTSMVYTEREGTSVEMELQIAVLLVIKY